MRTPEEIIEECDGLDREAMIRLAVQEAVKDIDAILEEDGAEKNLQLWEKIRDHFRKAGY